MVTRLAIIAENIDEITEPLKEKGYRINHTGIVFPNPYKLPEDYPWTPGSKRTGSLKKEEDKLIFVSIRGPMPLPCALISNETIEALRGRRERNILTFSNGDKPQIKKYHEEILKILYVPENN